MQRLAELLAEREWRVYRGDTDELGRIDSELANMGIPPPSNDNNSVA